MDFTWALERFGDSGTAALGGLAIGTTAGLVVGFLTSRWAIARDILLPLAIGMIMVNGLDPSGLFLSVGLFYIFTGIYFGITTPVQPMKVIAAYAIATAMIPSQILAW